MQLEPSKRIIVALDTTDLSRAKDLSRTLRGYVGGVKIGKELFTSHGPNGVRAILELGLPIFLDLKFHDIPNTVSGAMRSALELTPKIVNVHASGGKAMMKAAQEVVTETAQRLGIEKPLLLGVTVLTSLDINDLASIGINSSLSEQVMRLADLSQESGLDGVVCSATDVEKIRNNCGQEFVLLTPGIRPKWSMANDQKQVVSPSNAVAKGSDYLVIGRPITEADSPTEAVRLIIDELKDES